MSNKLYLQIRDPEFGYMISYITFNGDKQDLTIKLQSYDFAKKSGIPNELMFSPFRLLLPIELEEHKKGNVDYFFD